jgi:hypothetical protein
MCVSSHTLFDADRWVQVAQYMSAELGYLARACRVRRRVQMLKNHKSSSAPARSSSINNNHIIRPSSSLPITAAAGTTSKSGDPRRVEA